MSNIDPTEEQKQAAKALFDEIVGSPYTDRVSWVARLLAEREHKLREENDDLRADVRTLLYDLRKIHRDQLQADLDAARAEVEHFRKRLGETDVEACEARTELETARARIAELEADVDMWKGRDIAGQIAMGDVKWLREREAAHLAHIKALRRALEDRVDMGCDEVDALLGDTAHYDVEGAVAGIPVTDAEGGEG